MPGCTTTLKVDPDTNLPKASSSKWPFQSQNVSMRQALLEESLHGGRLGDAQMALAEAVYFSGSSMMMVDNVHWKRAWKK